MTWTPLCIWTVFTHFLSDGCDCLSQVVPLSARTNLHVYHSKWNKTAKCHLCSPYNLCFPIKWRCLDFWDPSNNRLGPYWRPDVSSLVRCICPCNRVCHHLWHSSGNSWCPCNWCYPLGCPCNLYCPKWVTLQVTPTSGSLQQRRRLICHNSTSQPSHANEIRCSGVSIHHTWLG